MRPCVTLSEIVAESRTADSHNNMPIPASGKPEPRQPEHPTTPTIHIRPEVTCHWTNHAPTIKDSGREPWRERGACHPPGMPELPPDSLIIKKSTWRQEAEGPRPNQTLILHISQSGQRRAVWSPHFPVQSHPPENRIPPQSPYT